MRIVEKTADLKEIVTKLKQNNHSIGFVPTMGALHQGHLELVNRSARENIISIVSIFVNPNQFNNLTDLQSYPRMIEKDCELLEKKTDNKLVFIPTIKEIYPKKNKKVYYFGTLETTMEGRFRPGHFNGVAQVIRRLFEIVKPNKAYFGEKDFQQLVIIRNLVTQLKLKIEIISHPTIREKNGLALSSRNIHLDQIQKEKASIVFKTLQESQKEKNHLSILSLKKKVTNIINSISGFRVEYFEIVDETTLQPIKNWKEATQIIGCIAVYIKNIRLIDNIKY